MQNVRVLAPSLLDADLCPLAIRVPWGGQHHGGCRARQVEISTRPLSQWLPFRENLF